ncbi:MAG: hypothetical protein QXN55_01795 [Candidatus Nitrosotenuis sp.]
MYERFSSFVKGRVKIEDKKTGELLLPWTSNAVHPQNMARTIARGLANEPYGTIFKLALGNGGTYIDSALKINYLQPNTTGVNASLYNQTYEEVIDDSSVSVGAGNSCISAASSVPGDLTSIVVATLTLGVNEPVGQYATDTAPNLVPANPPSVNPPYGPDTDFGYNFAFDELALLADTASNGASNAGGLLLTHLIFNPIQKSANREILITYSLTISVS